MKSPSSSRRGGFTLIELLVVIAIIVVLAAASFGMIPTMMNKAKRLTSVAAASALESAVNNFYAEYGSLPDVGDKVKTNTGEGIRLLNILLGLEGGSGKVQNIRSIKLLTVQETKTKSKGLLYHPSGKSVEGLYDAWGSPFTVELDVQYEERLRLNIGDKTVVLNGRRVAVYSPGADKKLGTNDDVRTW
jgi:prepilin-type N-terminal cleavage/methylation domain-containing protein